MPPPSILVISTAVDPATDEVVAEIDRRGGRVFRWNTEEFPFDSSLSWIPGERYSESVTIRNDSGSTFEVSGVGSVWYRRLRVPECPDGMNEGVYDFCLRESRAAMLGTLHTIPARIMSHPAAVWSAEFKPHQLWLARKAGLAIPQTVITNDPDAVERAFRDFSEQMVVKAVRTGYIDTGDEQLAIFTSRVLSEHLEHVEEASLCPSIYQKLIEKECDVRVTFVAGRFFVAEIDSQSDPSASVDWRRTEDPLLKHLEATIPEAVEYALRRLMTELHLEFGAIDLIKSIDGEYIFLEVNPNGQWLWIDDQLELGITSAVADWLVGEC